MNSTRTLMTMALLAAVLAGSVGVLGAQDASHPSPTQSAGTTGQDNTPVPATKDAAQAAPAGPSAEAPQAGPTRRRTSPQRRLSIDERVKAFARSLDLTEEQQAAVKTILEQQQQEILKIRVDPSLTGSAGIDRLRALQEITVERIRAILNEEQKRKYDPLAPRKIPTPPERSVEDWLNTT
ncbi:MAG TPA: hypothetical protein VMG30_14920 [Acidobacteriota bacterium]|nr:hypothetical protein [Acidobacteriota bacterium]